VGVPCVLLAYALADKMLGTLTNQIGIARQMQASCYLLQACTQVDDGIVPISSSPLNDPTLVLNMSYIDIDHLNVAKVIF